MDPYSIIPRKLPFSRANLPTKVVITYISDYVIILFLIAAFYTLDKVEPFHQRFSVNNYSLQYPYAEHERVPIFLALILVIIVPAGCIALYTMVIDGLFSHHKTPGSKRGPYTLRKRLWELNCGVLGLLLASGTAFVITSALKNATGKPRPDIMDRCRPSQEVIDAQKLIPYGLSIADEICDPERKDLLTDGFRSWPSGHSSSAFAGLFYLSLYLAGKLHILDSRGFVWKTFIIIIPTLGAALIAISRIMDARHHPFDVITGSMLGVLCAWGSYRQYFPPLTEPWRKGRAYPIRTWGGDGAQYVGDGGWRANEGVEGGGARAQASGALPGGMEPLRANTAPPGHGIERLNTVPLDADDDRPIRPGENVFRQEVERGHMARRDLSEEGRGVYSPRGRRDDWDDESSEDEDEERRARGIEAYELQPRRADVGAGPRTA